MTVDVVIVSDSSTKALEDMTNETIHSLVSSQPFHNFNITVYEKQPDITYRHATVFPQTGEFNYNRYMNDGIRLGSAEWIICANNDVVFHEGFFDAILKGSEEIACSSWGCWDDKTHGKIYEKFDPLPPYVWGYKVGNQITGWCVVFRRAIWNIIGGLDEKNSFWMSDNNYVEQLQRYKFRHALCTGAKVTHLGSKTLNSMTEEERNKILDDKPKSKMKLSILICGIPSRVNEAMLLYDFLMEQAEKYDDVEVLYLLDNKKCSVGSKRNVLVKSSQGEYICFVDDDDRVTSDYIPRLREVTQYKDDVITFEVDVFKNGEFVKMCYYNSDIDTENQFAYFRKPNHLMCIRRELMLSTPFEDISKGEDFKFAEQLFPKIKKMRNIDQVLYNYLFNEKTTETQNE